MDGSIFKLGSKNTRSTLGHCFIRHPGSVGHGKLCDALDAFFDNLLDHLLYNFLTDNFLDLDTVLIFSGLK